MTGAFVGIVGFTYGMGAGLGSDNALELAIWGLVIGESEATRWQTNNHHQLLPIAYRLILPG